MTQNARSWYKIRKVVGRGIGYWEMQQWTALQVYTGYSRQNAGHSFCNVGSSRWGQQDQSRCRSRLIRRLGWSPHHRGTCAYSRCLQPPFDRFWTKGGSLRIVETVQSVWEAIPGQERAHLRWAGSREYGSLMCILWELSQPPLSETCILSDMFDSWLVWNEIL